MLYGSVVAIAGSLGIIAGGRLCDLLHRRGYRDAPLRVAIVSAALTLPLNLVYLVGDGQLALALIALHVFTIAMPFGVGPAAIQEIMPNSMRGQASAVYLFVITLVGLGVGPTAVALGTDFVFGDDMALRYSLLVVTGIALVGAIILLGMGLKHYRGSLDRLQQWKPQGATTAEAQAKPV
ncbi:MFS family transporter [Pseudomonas sp. BAY1663]|nr:MFS family transporter [Pseudomonas sp. BAY1663]